MATASELINWATECRVKNSYAHIVVDTAQAENSHLQLARWEVPFVSLFEGKPEESVPEIAPLLIPLLDLAATKLEKVCEWAIRLGLQTPCVSWMESTLPVGPFSDHLRNFHTVSLSDGQRMMMRWYDTRILPVWLACLNAEQTKQFTASMLGIQYLNRFGDMSALFSAQAASAVPQAPPLGEPLVSLTDAQFSMLVDASGVDTLISHLRRVITDETNKVTPQVLFEFVGKYQQRVLEAGVDDLDRQTQYMLLALYTSGNGVEHPACVEFMKNPPNSLEDFYAAMQELPEDVWNAGLPLWERSASEKRI